MKISLSAKPLSEAKSDYLVLPLFDGEKEDYGFSEVKNFLKDQPKFGKKYQQQLLYTSKGKLLLVGLGKKDQLGFSLLQNWAGTAAKSLLRKAKSISLKLPESKLAKDQQTESLIIGAEMAFYDPAENYKSKFEPQTLESVEIIVPKDDQAYAKGLNKGQILSAAINLVRMLGDMPANQMTPTYFLNQTKKIAKETGLKLTILDESQAQEKGMGAFCGVAQGSEEPSYMIALEYNGNPNSKEKWGLVGKGITFDTGGISIKPSSSMHEMKYDMCGAASVLGSMLSLAKLKVKTNAVGVMAITENFPGGRAQRPGDIVKTYSGKMAEVIDTDAEGRLVLIDAISYAQKDFKANKLIDLATLTGAIIVALGDHITGVMGNNSEFTKKLIETGKKVGEKMWELPMDEEFNEMIKSDLADITNLGHGGSHRSAAGSITGAKFIEAAVQSKNLWVHLDIAGTAWDMKPKPYRGPGATGIGVKTLVELVS